MSHLTIASIGMILIGLVATGFVSWFTLRRIKSPSEIKSAVRWLGMFGLSICTMLCTTPLLGDGPTWILLFPLAGTWLSLDSLHHIGASSVVENSGRISLDQKTL